MRNIKSKMQFSSNLWNFLTSEILICWVKKFSIYSCQGLWMEWTMVLAFFTIKSLRRWCLTLWRRQSITGSSASHAFSLLSLSNLIWRHTLNETANSFLRKVWKNYLECLLALILRVKCTFLKLISELDKFNTLNWCRLGHFLKILI